VSEARAGATRHSARLATVALVRSGSRVLLLRHPPGSDRFAGRWNGIGGHVEAGEGVRAAARRELREEAGLEVGALRLRGVVHETGLHGHAYVVFFFVADVASPRLAPPRASSSPGTSSPGCASFPSWTTSTSCSRPCS